MPVSRPFKETILERAKRDSEFRLALHEELKKGEESGIVENFDIDEFQRKMDAELGTE